jgi:hypothetical protein
MLVMYTGRLRKPHQTEVKKVSLSQIQKRAGDENGAAHLKACHTSIAILYPILFLYGEP